MNNQISVTDVSFRYGKGKLVLKNLNLAVAQGERVGIVGANGVGKSTLLRLLVGLENGYEGSIRVTDMELTKENLVEIRKKIGYVFQDADSQMFLSNVYDNVSFGPMNYGYGKEEAARMAQEALEAVRIEHLKERSMYELSGGEKKLASIATILAMRPDIVLLDEPSVTLDPKNRRNLIHILNGLQKTKLIASHDLDFIMDTCDRTVLLHNGEIAADGSSRDILSDKNLMEENGLELPLSFIKR
ncbi:MAG: energy-coupling factor ABC transporter ATP-binding protein [Clostridium sp.]|nr:energy-coupling factor ABC transporter ATP-binding protein [Clostridium sp.]MCM1399478.1 energy-coupling factor ABC transporter ATP-binding protein [Clostridium sp.]MCM1460032.1 energy-coupling factor ABC transporter ATP-binding protein [Bacteroides sp.]